MLKYCNDSTEKTHKLPMNTLQTVITLFHCNYKETLTCFLLAIRVHEHIRGLLILISKH